MGDRVLGGESKKKKNLFPFYQFMLIVIICPNRSIKIVQNVFRRPSTAVWHTFCIDDKYAWWPLIENSSQELSLSSPPLYSKAVNLPGESCYAMSWEVNWEQHWKVLTRQGKQLTFYQCSHLRPVLPLCKHQKHRDSLAVFKIDL